MLTQTMVSKIRDSVDMLRSRGSGDDPAVVEVECQLHLAPGQHLPVSLNASLTSPPN